MHVGAFPCYRTGGLHKLQSFHWLRLYLVWLVAFPILLRVIYLSCRHYSRRLSAQAEAKSRGTAMQLDGERTIARGDHPPRMSKGAVEAVHGGKIASPRRQPTRPRIWANERSLLFPFRPTTPARTSPFPIISLKHRPPARETGVRSQSGLLPLLSSPSAVF